MIASQISKLRVEARLQAKGDALTQIGATPIAPVGNAVGGPANLSNAPARALERRPERR